MNLLADRRGLERQQVENGHRVVVQDGRAYRRSPCQYQQTASVVQLSERFDCPSVPQTDTDRKRAEHEEKYAPLDFPREYPPEWGPNRERQQQTTHHGHNCHRPVVKDGRNRIGQNDAQEDERRSPLRSRQSHRLVSSAPPSSCYEISPEDHPEQGPRHQPTEYGGRHHPQQVGVEPNARLICYEKVDRIGDDNRGHADGREHGIGLYAGKPLVSGPRLLRQSYH